MLNIRRSGNGKHAFLMVPGWGEDGTCFAPLLGHLPQGATALCIDPPGYGDSPAPDEYSMQQVVEPIANAARKAKEEHESLTLLGNCSGAILCCEALRHEGVTADALVMIDPFSAIPGYFRVFLNKGFGRQAYNMTFASKAGRAITNAALAGKRRDETDMTESFRVVSHEVTYNYLHIFSDVTGVEKYSGIDLPVRIIHGEKTFAAVRKGLKDWRAIWPHIEVHEIAGCGHLPISEAPEETASLVFSTVAVEASN